MPIWIQIWLQIGIQEDELVSLHKATSNAIKSASIPKSLFPLSIKKSPCAPHFLEYELRTIQYFFPESSSTPHPTSTTEWFWLCHDCPSLTDVLSPGVDSMLATGWLLISESSWRFESSAIVWESSWDTYSEFNEPGSESWTMDIMCFRVPTPPSERIPLWYN